jgi:N-acetyl sugar amidotransferase
MDSTVPGITFDGEEVCNFCHLQSKLEQEYPLGALGQARLEKMLAMVRRYGHGKNYDCIIGISGGRDSTFTLYQAVKNWGLRPLAVHFNDGFGNPVAGKNMVKATERLGVEMYTVSADWRESKDLRLSFLKASTPDTDGGCDIGISAALFGAAAKFGIKYILIGNSFRTEGICPLSWNYLDGKYISEVQKIFGTVKLRPWKPMDPGYNLRASHLFYYLLIKGIRTVTPLYYTNYVRKEADEILKNELQWEYTGAHYFDSLYQSVMTYVLREKFKIDRRKFNYSALIRSGQMPRAEALERVRSVYVIEDPKIIDLCIKRLGISREEFNGYLSRPPKTFRDYPSTYPLIRGLKWPIFLATRARILPGVTYSKFFNCGT